MKYWKKITAISAIALTVTGVGITSVGASSIDKKEALLDILSSIPSDVKVIRTTKSSLEEQWNEQQKSRLSFLNTKTTLTKSEEKEKIGLLNAQKRDGVFSGPDKEAFFSLQGSDKKGLRDAIIIQMQVDNTSKLNLLNKKDTSFGPQEATILISLYNGMKGQFQSRLDEALNPFREKGSSFDPSIQLEDLEISTIVPNPNHTIVQTGGRVNGMLNGFQLPLYVKGALVSDTQQKNSAEAIVLITLDTNRDYYRPLFENILKNLK